LLCLHDLARHDIHRQRNLEDRLVAECPDLGALGPVAAIRVCTDDDLPERLFDCFR
jgi:hypothetical protein